MQRRGKRVDVLIDQPQQIVFWNLILPIASSRTTILKRMC